MSMLRVALSLCILMCLAKAQAEPESFYPVARSATGPLSSGRFGASISCSAPLPHLHPLGGVSYIAVGAPEADAARGRVYIYEPDDMTSPVQVIASSSPGDGKKFGAAVAFIPDENDDGIDELVIGEPIQNTAPAPETGRVYVFLSRSDGNPSPFVELNYFSPATATAGFGSVLIALRGFLSPASNFAIGSPAASRVSSAYVTCSGSCPNSPCNCSIEAAGSSFSGSGGANSAYGHSLCELPTNVDSFVAVGAPNSSGNAGEINALDNHGGSYPVDSAFLQGSLGGMSVACSPAQLGTNFMGYLVPGVSEIQVREAISPWNFYCSAGIDISDIPTSSSAGLVHLEGAFNTLFSSSPEPSDIVMGSYRKESSTGGSIGMVRVPENVVAGACNELKQVNNCIADDLQQQGHTLVGGPDCRGDQTAIKAMLISGSPGWSNSRGRIDIYFAGQHRPAAQPCEATATPTSTPTNTPTATPTSTDTPMPTNTPTSTPTPLPEETSTPTSTPSFTDTPGETPTPPSARGDAPVIVDPQISPPALEVIESDIPKTVTLVAPTDSQSQFSPRFIQIVRKLLEKQFKKKYSDEQVIAALKQAQLFEFTVQETSKSRASVAALTAEVTSLSKKRAKVVKIRSRLNRVTVSRLTPGQTYSVTYRRVYTFKKPKKTFVTKPSIPRVFTKK